MIYNLVKSFDEDLQGAVDVDKYFNEVKDAVSKTPLKQLIGEFNETLKQHPKFRGLPDAEPDALYLMLTAGALFKASCENAPFSSRPDEGGSRARGAGGSPGRGSGRWGRWAPLLSCTVKSNRAGPAPQAGGGAPL